MTTEEIEYEYLLDYLLRFAIGLISMGLVICLISMASATTIIAGNNYTFSIDTTDNLFWDVIENSSNMDGFEVHQDIYDNYSNITFIVDYRFAPDSFTIILFSNQTKEIVKEVHTSSGGGGTRKIYVENKTIEYKTISNETEIDILTDKIDKLEKDLKNKEVLNNLLRILIGILFLTLLVITGIYLKKLAKGKLKKE